MNLILQAIKSLFRKLENGIAAVTDLIPKNLNDILRIIDSEKIPGQSIEDMYYTIPGEYKVVYDEQAHEMAELNYDEDSYVNKNEGTYGADIPDWKPADHGITEDSFDIPFTVVWDGVEYQCTSYDNTGYEMLTLGNPSIVRAGRDDTGEPFCILIDVYWGMEVQLYIRTNEPGTHTVAFGHTIKMGKTVRMAERYLPDGVSAAKIQKAKTAAETAQSTANAAKTAAETAQSTANTAKTAAETAQSTANTAKTAANAAKTTANTNTAKMLTIGAAKIPFIDKKWTSITYGNGKFVAIANSSDGVTQNSDAVAYSEDGVNWNQTTMPVAAGWNSITYGDGTFVAVSTSSAYSGDGVNWSQTTMPRTVGWNSITYGDGKFVAVANKSIAYSEDGISWETATGSVSRYWTSVTYGNGKFVAVSIDFGFTVYSEDGINWNQTTMPNKSWNSVAHGNGKFVAVATGSDIAVYSEDGVNWSQTTMPSNKNWHSVAYGNGKFVAVSKTPNAVAAYSEDGISWNETSLPHSDSDYVVAYGNGKFVVIGFCGYSHDFDGPAYSEDGIEWRDTYDIITQNNKDVTDNIKDIILGDIPDTIVQSVNGVTPDKNGNVVLEVSGGETVTDEHINSLIDAKLAAIPNAAEVAY